MNELTAYHNDAEIKAKYLARVQAHYDADEIKHGFYWESGKGCAVGCTVHSSNHDAYEIELGIPRVIAMLEDRIFEGLPNGESKEFPRQFLAVISVGADLSGVWPQFALWLMTDEKHGVRQYAKGDTLKAIDRVASLFGRQVRGDAPTRNEWSAADAAADAAAAAAAGLSGKRRRRSSCNCWQMRQFAR